MSPPNPTRTQRLKGTIPTYLTHDGDGGVSLHQGNNRIRLDRDALADLLTVVRDPARAKLVVYSKQTAASSNKCPPP